MGERSFGKAEALEEFSQRLRVARETAGLTQERLAEYASMHRTYVGHLEQGKKNPTLWSIMRVASGMDIDPGTLLEGLRARVD